MSSLVVGLDLSLTGTGIVAIAKGLHVDPPILSEWIEDKLVKSKPPKEKSPLSETVRLMTIRGAIAAFLDKKTPDLALIEGLAFSARNTSSLAQLSGLNYLVREYLAMRNIPFVIVAPTTLKKFVTGRGNAQKDLMLLETYKRYGRSYVDDNVCDAHALAQVGLALRGDQTEPLVKFQIEVVNLLHEQYENDEKEEDGSKK